MHQAASYPTFVGAPDDFIAVSSQERYGYGVEKVRGIWLGKEDGTHRYRERQYRIVNSCHMDPNSCLWDKDRNHSYGYACGESLTVNRPR
jgi:hypothetical protein